MKENIKLQFIKDFGCFEKGEIIFAIRLSSYFYKHAFWKIPQSVVIELERGWKTNEIHWTT